MIFSVVVPVYNRPRELRELLESLLDQDYPAFEVIIVEDGSSETSETIVKQFQDRLNLRYYSQHNQGQGFARNFGMEQAQGDYFVLFDSDCIIPSHYFSVLYEELNARKLDAHGGPDAAAQDFSIFQKAINFSMTSLWTTGGIRGKLKDPTKYQARGYNMGMSRAVFQATEGFVDPNRGEDIELSIRIKQMGYRLELIEEAFVYHKRKNTLFSFFAQSFSFGRNRINVNRYHPGSVQLVHLLPLFFLLGWLGWLLISAFVPVLKTLGAWVFGLWTSAVLVSATVQNKSLGVGLLAILTSYGQLFSYGAGIFWESVRKATNG
jgi:glycosyltransferase involved in cell wall biosynthesis